MKDTILYTVASYTAMALGIVVSIVTKALLGPIGSGYWAMMKVFSSYGEYSDLGTRNAMIREIPQALGAGQPEKIERMQNSAYAFTSAAAIFSAAVIAGIAFFCVNDGLLKKGLYVTAFLVIATQLYNFSLTLLRTLKKVRQLSVVIILNMVMVLVFSILGAYIKGVVGMAIGVFVATLLSAWNAYAWCGLRYHWEWRPEVIKRLLSIGFPMVIISYALVTFLGLDTLMIGKMLDYTQLGLYTIALMSVQQIGALGRFSQIILIPHIQERYGQTGKLEHTSPLFVRSTRVLAYVIPWLIAAVVFFVPVVVQLALPKFLGGLGAMKILVMGYYFVAVNELTVNAAYTADKQKQIIPFLAGMIVVAAGLNYCFIKRGWGIEGVALATGISYFLCFIVTFSFSYSHYMGRSAVLKMIAGILGIFIYFALCVAIADHIVTIHASLILEACVKFLFFALCFLPLFFRIEKDEHLFAILTGMVRRKAALR